MYYFWHLYGRLQIASESYSLEVPIDVISSLVLDNIGGFRGRNGVITPKYTLSRVDKIKPKKRLKALEDLRLATLYQYIKALSYRYTTSLYITYR